MSLQRLSMDKNNTTTYHISVLGPMDISVLLYVLFGNIIAYTMVENNIIFMYHLHGTPKNFKEHSGSFGTFILGVIDFKKSN